MYAIAVVLIAVVARGQFGGGSGSGLGEGGIVNPMGRLLVKSVRNAQIGGGQNLDEVLESEGITRGGRRGGGRVPGGRDGGRDGARGGGQNLKISETTSNSLEQYLTACNGQGIVCMHLSNDMEEFIDCVLTTTENVNHECTEYMENAAKAFGHDIMTRETPSPVPGTEEAAWETPAPITIFDVETCAEKKKKKSCIKDSICKWVQIDGQYQCIKKVCQDASTVSFNQLKTADKCLEAIGMGYCGKAIWTSVNNKKVYSGCGQ